MYICLKFVPSLFIKYEYENKDGKFSIVKRNSILLSIGLNMYVNLSSINNVIDERFINCAFNKTFNLLKDRNFVYGSDYTVFPGEQVVKNVKPLLDIKEDTISLKK